MKKEYQATNYESDLTDEQWEAIKEFFPSGNKSKYHKGTSKSPLEIRSKCSAGIEIATFATTQSKHR